MPNIATELRAEIARLARKELRAETEALKKSSSRYRSEIAELKRRVVQLERNIARASKGAAAAAPLKTAAGAAEEGDAEGLRFRAPGLASHRQRLGLSAREAGQIMGVSALTVYNWESGKTHPRRGQMPAIAAFRQLGKREAQSRLAS